MIQLALITALLLQAPDTLPIFDSPATEALVLRAIAASGEIPADLNDYRAEVHTTMQISIAADTLGLADLPATVDELVSEVRWQRGGYLHQEVIGHRLRVLVPLPYTLATIIERPWVIPHLYGTGIYAPLGGRPAINPFGASGPRYYRYQAQDTVRIRLPDQLLTLIPITVRPRVGEEEADAQLLLGTFHLDADRAAVARARVGFAGGEDLLPSTMGQIDTFLELENGLWEGRWLPFRQRRDILMESRLLGATVAARVVNRFVDVQLNTGWAPGGDLVLLDWNLGSQREAFATWRAPLGDEESALSIGDFADLRLATAAESRPAQGVRAQFHYRRGSDLFRFNRVEGVFLGLGGRLIPADAQARRWELYGTGGWARSESTARGELVYRRGAALAPLASPGRTDWGLELGAYRRLRDIQPFRPTFMWDWFYTLPALLWGSDPRDYYGAAGTEASLLARRGVLSGRGTVRIEQHDSVSVNAARFLFGTATDFGPLPSVEPGTLVALEAGSQYAFGPGAFGIGNSLLTRAEGELGFADFRYYRLTGLLSLRYGLGPLTLAARADGGIAWGDVPPQKLFRFGSVEGLRGYEANEFGGSKAVLARARGLIGIPPRSARPLARAGLLLIPPLRPNLVFLAESGWTEVDPQLGSELGRLRARVTDGFRSSVGFGLSIFDDAFTVERLQPIRDEEERPARWYVGLTYWY